jgi:hypothetical protein
MLIVLKNRAQRKIFGLKGDDVTRKWRKMHCEKLHHLSFVLYLNRVIKLRRKGRTGVW